MIFLNFILNGGTSLEKSTKEMKRIQKIHKKMKKIQNVNSPKSGIELDGSSECPLIFGGGGGGGLID